MQRCDDIEGEDQEIEEEYEFEDEVQEGESCAPQESEEQNDCFFRSMEVCALNDRDRDSGCLLNLSPNCARYRGNSESDQDNDETEEDTSDSAPMELGPIVIASPVGSLPQAPNQIGLGGGLINDGESHAQEGKPVSKDQAATLVRGQHTLAGCDNAGAVTEASVRPVRYESVKIAEPLLRVHQTLDQVASSPPAHDTIETTDASLKSTLPDLDRLQSVIEQHFPHLWPAVEAGLSVCATLLLADNANPTALIYVGPSGAGKTTVARLFEEAKFLVYRSDEFTARSFVSHSANKSLKDLETVDLLPRIKDKILLTPELATTFRGNFDDLTKRFSVITRVLDGQGYVCDSGVHGQRGYTGDHLFTWIGCTTPFEPVVWKVMAQLGSRLFFCDLTGVGNPSPEDLLRVLSRGVSYHQAVKECQQEVRVFLETIFTRHGGVRGVNWNAEEDPEIVRTISRLATLLAVLRTYVDGDRKPQPESPYRANAVLYNIARGHALISGRTQLAAEDVPLIARITLSSMPKERASVLAALSARRTTDLTVKNVGLAANVSRHTAERIMEDLDRIGFAKFSEEGKGRSSGLALRPEWRWCIEPGFASLIRDTARWQKLGGAWDVVPYVVDFE